MNSIQRNSPLRATGASNLAPIHQRLNVVSARPGAGETCDDGNVQQRTPFTRNWRIHNKVKSPDLVVCVCVCVCVCVTMLRTAFVIICVTVRFVSFEAAKPPPCPQLFRINFRCCHRVALCLLVEAATPAPALIVLASDPMDGAPGLQL